MSGRLSAAAQGARHRSVRYLGRAAARGPFMKEMLCGGGGVNGSGSSVRLSREAIVAVKFRGEVAWRARLSLSGRGRLRLAPLDVHSASHWPA